MSKIICMDLGCSLELNESTSANNASAQGAKHVAGLLSMNMKYACPQIQA